MRRRRYQRGSVKPRKRDGRLYWYAQWREKGEPRSKELGLCSKVSRPDAEAMLSAILRPINEDLGRKIQEVFTFQGFVDKVYLPIHREKWKASTAETEEYRLRAHLVRTIGNQLLHRIDRDRLQLVLNGAARSVGRDVLDHLRFRLGSIFELAMSEGLIERNPAIALYTPRNHKKGRPKLVLTCDQILTMLEVLEQRERVIARLAILEGMRPSEILGLQRQDWDADSVWVRRRVIKNNVDTPKNDRSARRVALSDGTALLLSEWVGGLVATEQDAWLFPSETMETPVRRNNLWRRNFEPKLKTIDLGWANFQVMRRSFASLAKQAGVDAHTRSAHMGNSVDVNENEYAVSSFEARLAAVRKLEASVEKHRSGESKEGSSQPTPGQESLDSKRDQKA